MTKAITIQNKYQGCESRKLLKVDGDIKIDIFQDGKKVTTVDTRTNQGYLNCDDNIIYGTIEHLAALKDNKNVISQKDIEKAGWGNALRHKHNIKNVIFNSNDPTKITVIYDGKQQTTMTVDIENKEERGVRIKKAKIAAAKRVANCLNSMGITPPSWLPIK